MDPVDGECLAQLRVQGLGVYGEAAVAKAKRSGLIGLIMVSVLFWRKTLKESQSSFGTSSSKAL